MGKLTVKGIEALKAPGMYGDGGGLYLRIGPGGARNWAFRAVIGGQRRELGLGPADCLSLAEARAKAAAFRETVMKGGDPDAPRRAEREVAKLARFMAPSSTHGAIRPSWLRPAMKGEARPKICPVDRFQRRTGGAPDCVFQWPKGARSISRWPTKAQPVVLTRSVLSEVSSIKTSLPACQQRQAGALQSRPCAARPRRDATVRRRAESVYG